MRIATSVLFFCVASLLALGMVMLFSASTGQPEANYLVMQPIWCAIGLTACLTVAAGNYQWLKKYWWLNWVFFGITLVLLALVLVPGIRINVNGAYRWLRFSRFSIQPSELAKIALILVLAWYGERYQRQMPTFWKGLVFPGLIIAPVLALVFLEPDVGTTMLLATLAGVMLFVAGTRLRFLVPPIAAGVAGLIVFILHNPMRLRRIMAFLYPEQNREEVGYQTYQAMVAIGSGGLTGLGLGDGRQKLGSIPEHHTDFIFSVIGEELGLVATMLVIVAFVVMVICGVYIALKARDNFGMLLASGVSFLMGLQAAINIGVVTGSLPNKGLSLPFISYGGSNLVVMLACVGLLINVARRAGDEPIPRGVFDPLPQTT
ncbi:MAG TPA: putative lipid II flippase FtsW [Verrucomicrobiae bacterium]|nr:putative lipid II flippase FtsW [Verrucomicrobiae bacterium]